MDPTEEISDELYYEIVNSDPWEGQFSPESAPENLPVPEEDVSDELYFEITGSDPWEGLYPADQTGTGQALPDNIGAYLDIQPMEKRRNGKFGIHSKRYGVTLKDLPPYPFSQAPALILQILEHILSTVLESVPENEMVRLCIESRSLTFPIWTPPTKRSELTVLRWMAEVEKVLNSQQEFALDEGFRVQVEYTETPSGSCLRHVPDMLWRKMNKLQSVLVIRNDGQLCLARALVVGQALAEKEPEKPKPDYRYKLLLRGKKLQAAAARELIRRAGLPERKYSVADLPSFEKALPGYQIFVLDVNHGNTIIYKSATFSDKKIHLLHHSDHFDVMKSFLAWFQRSYWCYTCDKGYDQSTAHRCGSRCLQCHSKQCVPDESSKIFCTECRRPFHGQGCFDNHKKAATTGAMKYRQSICSRVFVCEFCHKLVNMFTHKNPHCCGESFCCRCKEYVIPADHQCFMKRHVRSAKEDKDHKEAKFLFFDFETYVDGNGELIPNLAVVQDMQGNETVFPGRFERMGRNISDDICKFIFQPKHRDHYVIAHNFRGFDGYFVIRWLLHNGITPEVVMNGQKIMQMDVRAKFNIRFRDSYNYNPQSLASWPATFGITEVSKGQFPHRFNRPENWDKTLPFPDMSEYNYDSMRAAAKPAFNEWHRQEKEAKGGLFQFREEFVRYCSLDVTTLRVCCLKFRQQFMDISNGLCPFVSSSTIAGLCNKFWRSNFLQVDQIGLLPVSGFNANRPQSAKALQWLAFCAEDSGVDIRTQQSECGEIKLGRYYVDGFCRANNTVYEFYGCWYHGCKTCHMADTLHPLRNLPMGNIFTETIARENDLKSDGYNVVNIWEHDFDRRLLTDPDFRRTCMTANISLPLNPREAFYGGRTNAFRLRYTAKPGEEIRYYDVCSEYPFVNKTKRYPVGHPRVIRKDFADPRSYFGIIKCRVMPPRNLLIPVLPYRCDKKLLFPLCRTCAETKLNAPCLHCDSERAITGSWCTPEIHKALDLGYNVEEIFEVWDFPDSKERLFQEYIDMFLKIKVEASGWPCHVKTDADQEDFLEQFWVKEGVRLEKDKIALNPGLRALAKLCLNSFWGRLGMQDNKATTTHVTTTEQFHHYLLSGKYCVSSWDTINDQILQLTYKREDGFVEPNSHTNVVLAAFTTCWARLHILQYMDMVRDNLLYVDTDSLVYVHKPGHPGPPTGDFLGDLTNELKPGQFITEFVSLGPKTYAYQTNDGQSVVKMKGFTLNGHSEKVISFFSMLNLLNDKEAPPLSVTYPGCIVRNKRAFALNESELSKRLKVTYAKRRIIDDDFNTLPFGYCLA